MRFYHGIVDEWAVLAMKGVSACGRTNGPSAEGLAEGLVVCRGWGFSPADATASGPWCLFAVQITVIKHGSESRTQCFT